MWKRVFGLSEREVEVVKHVAQGKTNGQIAGDMDLSTATVKHHLETARHKLGASNRAQAVSKAHELDLID